MPTRSQNESLLPVGTALIAFLLYFFTLAPGLTWAHHGEDGGELLAAAVSNGVPHPPGYPLYMLLLQGWLSLLGWLLPGSDLAWRGNLFSALLAAFSVGLTVVIATHLAKTQTTPASSWWWAGLAGMAWAITPLLWSQALITEVYALHALLVALLGWALLVKGGQTRWLAPVIALGVAHHLTFVLLLPGVLYYLLFGQLSQVAVNPPFWPRLWQAIGTLALGGLGGALLYVRTPLVASYGAIPPPINWGYARDWAGFWWLVSGSAYRGYLFNLPSSEIINRLAAWAYTLTSQYTPVGLALALVGLAQWDQQKPVLRNLALCWVVPLSIYTISYNTRDSEIYLLPVAWLAALWLAEGLPATIIWLVARFRVDWLTPVAGAVVAIGLVVLVAIRLPALSLRHDQQAQDFLASALTIVPAHSIVVTSADAETFAFWYAAWGTGELLQRVPDVTVVNYSLYQFPWYQRLMSQRYPNVPGSGESVEALLAQNKGLRPVFFSEKLAFVPAESLTPIGPLWQYKE